MSVSFLQVYVPTFARAGRRLVVMTSKPITRWVGRIAGATVASSVILLAGFVWAYGLQSERRWSVYHEHAAVRGVLREGSTNPSKEVTSSDNLAAPESPFAAQMINQDGTVQPTRWSADFDWMPLKALPSLMKSKRGNFGSDERSARVAANSDEHAQGAQRFLSMFEQKMGGEWAKVIEAEARPQTFYGIRYWPLPQSGKIPFLVYRKVAQMHALRAVAMLESGRSAEALKEVKGGFRLVRALEESDGTTLVSYMFQGAITRLMIEPVWHGLVNGRWSDAELDQLQEELSRISPSRQWTQALDAERAFQNAILDHLAALPFHERPQEIRALLALKEGSPTLLLVSLKGVIRESQIAANSWLDAARGLLDSRGQLQPMPETVYDPDRMSGIERKRYFWADIVSPNTLRAATRMASVETRVRQARLAIALERYRRDEGRVPDHLDQLVPEYMPEVPLDPFDGKPLRYARESDSSYRLWSVGSNHTDDGGKSAAKEDDVNEVFDLMWPGLAPVSGSPGGTVAANRDFRPQGQRVF